MQVILLERIPKLGAMGEEVRVKDGYARNFLLPQEKALRATAANRARFERDRQLLVERNNERREAAEAVGSDLNGKSFIVVRQAAETGQLYGSVSTRDISELLIEDGFKVVRNQVVLNTPIKVIGLHEVELALHSEVSVSITLNVARSADEAERQAEGEDLTLREDDYEIETFSEDDLLDDEDDRRERNTDVSEPTGEEEDPQA